MKIREVNGAASSWRPQLQQYQDQRPSKGWAEMIRKVYEVDPMLCPIFGGKMKIITSIEEPKVIDKIIRHLKLNFCAERLPPSQVARQKLLPAAEEQGDNF